ncbi:MbcA/ParS/Xre antitoxin family protein [Sphingomonas sp. MG17]|uniref:MbcA/ParS/Xre antitoxin family protein n=1 Tax=Sphingomonas tagetis TaxID=2949092 RepID=A0A9X2HMV8_9SPHN|nr:antitoxin Xre-like helix-turn-helix domain-containing protein [Sphingomonas tagetis]MCP3732194.1 MbcA/ParS/Xre antitoxin family protein [Sphingomonas tagetis]
MLHRESWRTVFPEARQIEAVPPASDADLVTPDEAAAMFRAVLNLFEKWDLTDPQAAALLGMPVNRYRRWRAQGGGRHSSDGCARLSNLISIHRALRVIFPESRCRYHWIRAANEVFGGASALEVMLGGELTGIMRVRRYLDAEMCFL